MPRENRFPTLPVLTDYANIVAISYRFSLTLPSRLMPSISEFSNSQFYLLLIKITTHIKVSNLPQCFEAMCVHTYMYVASILYFYICRCVPTYIYVDIGVLYTYRYHSCLQRISPLASVGLAMLLQQHLAEVLCRSVTDAAAPPQQHRGDVRRTRRWRCKYSLLFVNITWLRMYSAIQRWIKSR